MKKRNCGIYGLIYGLALCGICALVLGACFAPYTEAEGGDAYLSITLPGADSRVAVTNAEKAGMRYEISLTGPGDPSPPRH
jgi:hypothetical protein